MKIVILECILLQTTMNSGMELQERYGSSFGVQTLLAFTMPGMPLLYNGQERV